MSQIKILIAPLDWGLGHATRCVPVINEFLRQGCEIQIATSGDALILLRKEFPLLKFHSISSYDARYSLSIPFALKILIQVPKFLVTKRNEQRQTERIVDKEKIDLVISDNRYGCWSTRAKSVFIGHQLNLRPPFFSGIINYFHSRALRRFTECWVPDEQGNESFAGELAVNTALNPKYIGMLSRMKFFPAEPRYKVLAIVSGPEPQRTALELTLFKELERFDAPCLMVRGNPGGNATHKFGKLEVVDHLSSEEMNKAMLESEVIIARSGYSTIMDLAVVGKKAIFIPTPGQPEQEYLASELIRKKIAPAVEQDEFSLQYSLTQLDKFTGFRRSKENQKLAPAVTSILHEIN